MADNKYFQAALSSFTAEFAYAASVRHLHDIGYTPKQIKEHISYPVSIEKIQKVIDEYEAKKDSLGTEYEFIQDTDSLGRKSFRRVKKETRDLFDRSYEKDKELR